MSESRLAELFDRLWRDFTEINPQAEAIHQLLRRRGDEVVNDHIAFRTFDDPRVNIAVLARPFLAGGYRAAGEYNFAQKKLTARHFEHPNPDWPKVFISELRLADVPQLRPGILQLIDQIPAATLEDENLCAAGRPWDLSHATYQELADQSEYAGWMSAFGFRANHFTVLVNRLTSVSSLAELNGLIRSAGFPLNADGGEIKGSPAELLEQSSTLASQVKVEFSDGLFVVPGCYYEFARRYAGPDGKLFSGFVPTSADKIFQSTDRRG